MKVEPYLVQRETWPDRGRVILAQFDERHVVVYQAFRPEIAEFAAERGYFGGGGFSFERMSWVKPGFLWMMYRSGWATKPNQERILAVSIHRSAFDEVMAEAVESVFAPGSYASRDGWKDAIARSNVRVQWDPDHGPSGEPLARRSIQLGLRGDTLARYSRDWIVGVEDITPFVHVQAFHARAGDLHLLMTPSETAYPVGEQTALQIGMADVQTTP